MIEVVIATGINFLYNGVQQYLQIETCHFQPVQQMPYVDVLMSE